MASSSHEVCFHDPLLNPGAEQQRRHSDDLDLDDDDDRPATVPSSTAGAVPSSSLVATPPSSSHGSLQVVQQYRMPTARSRLLSGSSDATASATPPTAPLLASPTPPPPSPSPPPQHTTHMPEHMYECFVVAGLHDRENLLDSSYQPSQQPHILYSYPSASSLPNLDTVIKFCFPEGEVPTRYITICEEPLPFAPRAPNQDTYLFARADSSPMNGASASASSSSSPSPSPSPSLSSSSSTIAAATAPPQPRTIRAQLKELLFGQVCHRYRVTCESRTWRGFLLTLTYAWLRACVRPCVRMFQYVRTIYSPPARASSFD